MLSPEIGQLIDLHANTCNNVQKGIRMQTSMKSGILSDSLQFKQV